MKKLLGYIFILMACLVGIYMVIFYTTPVVDNNVNNSNKIVTLTTSKTLDKLEKKEQGLYYIGFPECPWCKELVPILVSRLPRSEKIYSLNTHSKSFSKNDQYRLQKIYSDYYDDNPTVPFVISINSRKETLTHVGTVPTHNAKINDLTKKEKEELMEDIDELINWTMK